MASALRPDPGDGVGELVTSEVLHATNMMAAVNAAKEASSRFVANVVGGLLRK